MVIRTFRQPGANELVDARRLTSSSAPLFILTMKSGDMRGNIMVTRTFRQPGENEPVDARRLTSSSAPFVVLTREVRSHAGLPLGYLQLSSTIGN